MALLDYTYGGELEFFLSQRLSLGPTFHYRDSTSIQRETQLQLFSYGLKLASVIGPTRADREGWYSSISLMFNEVRVRAVAQRSDLTMWGGAFYSGYQWSLSRWDPRFTIRVGMGIAYKEPEVGTDTLLGTFFPTIANERLDPSIDFTLGFAI